MLSIYRKRRLIIAVIFFAVSVFTVINNTPSGNKPDLTENKNVLGTSLNGGNLAIDALKLITIKGRAPKTDYTREQFGNGWATVKGCDTRNIILNRDLQNVIVNEKCEVVSGILDDPYSGKIIDFNRGDTTSGDVQIDHVVALSDAWQKGAQLLSKEQRVALANDPLELLAVDGPTNIQKSDGDAATWLPPNKAFRCEYVARQIAVKQKYSLWMTQAEYDSISKILNKCSSQKMP